MFDIVSVDCALGKEIGLKAAFIFSAVQHLMATARQGNEEHEKDYVWRDPADGEDWHLLSIQELHKLLDECVSRKATRTALTFLANEGYLIRKSRLSRDWETQMNASYWYRLGPQGLAYCKKRCG